MTDMFDVEGCNSGSCPVCFGPSEPSPDPELYDTINEDGEGED